jgi:hypothetical protein
VLRQLFSTPLLLLIPAVSFQPLPYLLRLRMVFLFLSSPLLLTSLARVFLLQVSLFALTTVLFLLLLL